MTAIEWDASIHNMLRQSTKRAMSFKKAHQEVGLSHPCLLENRVGRGEVLAEVDRSSFQRSCFCVANESRCGFILENGYALDLSCHGHRFEVKVRRMLFGIQRFACGFRSIDPPNLLRLQRTSYPKFTSAPENFTTVLPRYQPRRPPLAPGPIKNPSASASFNRFHTRPAASSTNTPFFPCKAKCPTACDKTPVCSTTDSATLGVI